MWWSKKLIRYVHLYAVALQLGCFPRRASRSQRNNNHVCYLTRNSESANVCGGNPKPTSYLAPHCSDFLGKQPQNLGLPVKTCLNSEPHSRNGLPCQGSFPSQSYVAYPIYYGAYSRRIEPELVLGDHSTHKYTSNSYSQMGVSQRISLSNEENIRCRGEWRSTEKRVWFISSLGIVFDTRGWRCFKCCGLDQTRPNRTMWIPTCFGS